jgi:hypothetical protein
MNKYPDHDYVNLQLLEYGVDKLVTSKQNFVDMMTQHRSKGICNVDNIRPLDSRVSSKLPNATSKEFFGQHVFIVAHLDVNVNLRRR